MFTPTYNRAHLLPITYASLRAQTFRPDGFEWLIVDDGSADGTADLVEAWRKEAPFPIRYVWQANSGHAAALNRGVREARGYLFVGLDSDDWLGPTALERCLDRWLSIPEAERSGFAGVAALYGDPAGRVIGTRYPTADMLDSDAVDIRVRHRVEGDKFGANRTEVLRAFPFPTDLGVTVAPALAWNRIAERYRTRYFNETLAFKDFQPDGISARIGRLRARSPLAAVAYYREFVSLKRRLPPDLLLRNYANFVRFSLHARNPLRRQVGVVPSALCWACALPLGIALYLRDRWELGADGGVDAPRRQTHG